MSRVYLGIGSNVDAENHVRIGIAALRQRFGTVQLSPVYRCEAAGYDGEDFLNLVAAIETDLQPLDLKRWLNDLEDQNGRQRDKPSIRDRTLDIDMLLYDDLNLRLPSLELPRSEILEFAHVLLPLADLAPELIHPQTGRSMSSHWASFDGPRQRCTAIEIPGA